MTMIEGRKNGYMAEVTADNRLQTETSALAAAEATNLLGRSFILYFEVIPSLSPLIKPNDPSGENPSAYLDDNPFLYIKNTSERDMIITRFSAFLTADNAIIFRKNPFGDPDGDSFNSETPQNLNFSADDIADGKFFVGENITGLGSLKDQNEGEGDLIKVWRINDNDGETSLSFNSSLIIETNDSLALHILAKELPVEMSVEFYYA